MIRIEPVVALVAASHAYASEPAVSLSALADEEFVLFPRELAPRLYDVLVGLCRSAGFEPKLRSGSFHTGWDLRSRADGSVVALAPRSVASDPSRGVVALPLTEPTDQLDLRLVRRSDDRSATVDLFRSVARAVYGTAPRGVRADTRRARRSPPACGAGESGGWKDTVHETARTVTAPSRRTTTDSRTWPLDPVARRAGRPQPAQTPVAAVARA